MCSAMNYCNGRGWCNNGQCECYNQTVKGADCSNEVLYTGYPFNNGSFEGKGQKWVYFSANLSSNYYQYPSHFTLNSSTPYDLYISQ